VISHHKQYNWFIISRSGTLHCLYVVACWRFTPIYSSTLCTSC